MTNTCHFQRWLTRLSCDVRLRNGACEGLHCVAASRAELPRWRRCGQRTVLALLAVSFVSMATGCGYTTQRPFRTDIQTIHVEMFQSKEFRRELEMSLTEAVIKRIQMDTPYQLAPRESADALLTGEILSVDNRIFGDDIGTDLPREIGATVTVRYRLQDLRNGKVLVERPRFIYQASYIPPVGESFTTGMIRGLDGMAERIVETMEVDW